MTQQNIQPQAVYTSVSSGKIQLLSGSPPPPPDVSAVAQQFLAAAGSPRFSSLDTDPADAATDHLNAILDSIVPANPAGTPYEKVVLFRAGVLVWRWDPTEGWSKVDTVEGVWVPLRHRDQSDEVWCYWLGFNIEEVPGG